MSTDLSTYEGRRAAWAQEMAEPGYVQFSSGGLRSMTDDEGRKSCCCLGVACELIIRVDPSVLRRVEAPTDMRGRDCYRYEPVNHPDNASSGFLPVEVAEWLGLYATSPTASLDQVFVAEFTALQQRRTAEGQEPLMIPDAAGHRVDRVLGIGQTRYLSALNDAYVPFELIAGLIARERLLEAIGGPIVTGLWARREAERQLMKAGAS